MMREMTPRPQVPQLLAKALKRLLSSHIVPCSHLMSLAVDSSVAVPPFPATISLVVIDKVNHVKNPSKRSELVAFTP